MGKQESACVMSAEPEPLLPGEDPSVGERESSTTALRVIGWFSAGMAVAALGIYVGYELTSRYRFKRRTPYDFYSNAGEKAASEFGVGV